MTDLGKIKRGEHWARRNPIDPDAIEFWSAFGVGENFKPGLMCVMHKDGMPEITNDQINKIDNGFEAQYIVDERMKAGHMVRILFDYTEVLND